ncbi:uncharacterized protein LOC143292447 isoform X2 [Babylonia areolata]
MTEAYQLVFGIIADVQYADADDGSNFAQTRRRYYRTALESLKKAVTTWNTSYSNLAFVLQLGDLIDGVNKRKYGKQVAENALKAALVPFREMACPTYHMVGNHDLYNLTRTECLESELNCSRLPTVEGVEGALYYSVLVHPQLKIIVLDSYDVGVLGYSDCPDHPHFLEAQRILEEENPNDEKNSAVGLKGVSRRFVAYNGGIGKQQLAWLDEQLTKADSQEQNVLICGHVQLNSKVASSDADVGTCLAWNYAEVQEVLHSHGCVVGCLMGHDHDGSYFIDSVGIHQLVMNGVIETPPGTDAFATAFLHERTLEIQGHGVVPSASMPLRYFVGGERCISKGESC